MRKSGIHRNTNLGLLRNRIISVLFDVLELPLQITGWNRDTEARVHRGFELYIQISRQPATIACRYIRVSTTNVIHPWLFRIRAQSVSRQQP